jgi:hypothetical protein
MELVPDQLGHVSESDLIQRGFEAYSPPQSGLPTYINYNKIHCGTCDEIMLHVKDIASSKIVFMSSWRYCKKCQILIKFTKLEVIRVRFD